MCISVWVKRGDSEKPLNETRCLIQTHCFSAELHGRASSYTKMVMVFGYSEVSLCPVFPGRKMGKEQEDGHSPNLSALVKGLADQVTGLGPTVLESMVLSTPTHSIDLYFSGWHPAFPP